MHFLCTWHVLRAMQKQTWQKMDRNSKADFTDILSQAHDLMYMKIADSTPHEAKLQAAQQRMRKLLDEWSASSNGNYQRAAVYYEYWYNKIGARLVVAADSPTPHWLCLPQAVSETNCRVRQQVHC
jgi:hypothetical protein